MLNVTCTEYILLYFLSPNIITTSYLCCFKSLSTISDYATKSDVSQLECLSQQNIGIVIIHLL